MSSEDWGPNKTKVWMGILKLLTVGLGTVNIILTRNNNVQIHNNAVDAAADRDEVKKEVQEVDKRVKEVKKQNMVLMQMKGMDFDTEKDQERRLRKGPLDPVKD